MRLTQPSGRPTCAVPLTKAVTSVCTTMALETCHLSPSRSMRSAPMAPLLQVGCLALCDTGKAVTSEYKKARGPSSQVLQGVSVWAMPGHNPRAPTSIWGVGQGLLLLPYHCPCYELLASGEALLCCVLMLGPLTQRHLASFVNHGTPENFVLLRKGLM